MSLQFLTLIFLLSAAVIYHIPVVTCEPWCSAMPSSTPEQLQANIQLACSRVDCTPIQPGGFCYYPNTLLDHASFVMNSYYKSQGRTYAACSFGNTGYLIYSDPSTGTCEF
ncbi:putative X8 domain-containing protein [Arabidopsis thaliana]|uniref:Carbohydrate-binding X8 domain superfamily protein n=4 Tax=Arabidopsis TaxID=3701 RepID=Q9FJC3_ARATH|nr:Carbohydrate-binding X8 domain superfamily protein [Arabidopsis thaliana]KAG7605958.1 X8 domain [Arabidopsis thaliana x Arabidopsis arenosa]KAG7612875.1 X8 domain [Arabidopsis suecica]AED96385.1 Carbohydrate-binding X8 domain superfamily protein [Arabidopsis thaliana]OAO94202.1 hypothetical protein AXX17_AT5G52580 [Arabidopsis thaliana]CAA0409579.1 unnamed protein product [Arabidopsis thaliana]|eukprot:NP_200173.1 Carbohydrate-binding X8 domain superfamily protein [Arabidopsis thaliana]